MAYKPVYAIATSSVVTIAAGETKTINKHGACYIITNNTGKLMYVPTNSSDEWEIFIDRISQVDIVSC
jgi:hypothetical protein